MEGKKNKVGEDKPENNQLQRNRLKLTLLGKELFLAGFGEELSSSIEEQLIGFEQVELSELYLEPYSHQVAKEDETDETHFVSDKELTLETIVKGSVWYFLVSVQLGDLKHFLHSELEGLRN